MWSAIGCSIHYDKCNGSGGFSSPNVVVQQVNEDIISQAGGSCGADTAYNVIPRAGGSRGVVKAASNVKKSEVEAAAATAVCVDYPLRCAQRPEVMVSSWSKGKPRKFHVKQLRPVNYFDSLCPIQ